MLSSLVTWECRYKPAYQFGCLIVYLSAYLSVYIIYISAQFILHIFCTRNLPSLPLLCLLLFTFSNMNYEKKLFSHSSLVHWFISSIKRTWLHLESIFIGSDDIRKQLPEDTARFERIDTEFKECAAEMSQTTNVVESCSIPGKHFFIKQIKWSFWRKTLVTTGRSIAVLWITFLFLALLSLPLALFLAF